VAASAATLRGVHAPSSDDASYFTGRSVVGSEVRASCSDPLHSRTHARTHTVNRIVLLLSLSLSGNLYLLCDSASPRLCDSRCELTPATTTIRSLNKDSMNGMCGAVADLDVSTGRLVVGLDGDGGQVRVKAVNVREADDGPGGASGGSRGDGVGGGGGDHHVLKPATCEWRRYESGGGGGGGEGEGPEARWEHTITVVGSEVIVLGGWGGKPWGDGIDFKSQKGQAKYQSEIYTEMVEMWAAPVDMVRGEGPRASESWRRVTWDLDPETPREDSSTDEPPPSIMYHTAVEWKGRMYVFGGNITRPSLQATDALLGPMMAGWTPGKQPLSCV